GAGGGWGGRPPPRRSCRRRPRLLSDPSVALATPPGRGALALLRLSGVGSFAIAARCLDPFHPTPPRTVFRARLLHPDSGEPVDDCLVACFPAPHSHTADALAQ